MYFLFDHLIPGTFVNCYADTDSMALATTSLSEPLNLTDFADASVGAIEAFRGNFKIDCRRF